MRLRYIINFCDNTANSDKTHVFNSIHLSSLRVHKTAVRNYNSVCRKVTFFAWNQSLHKIKLGQYFVVRRSIVGWCWGNIGTRQTKLDQTNSTLINSSNAAQSDKIDFGFWLSFLTFDAQSYISWKGITQGSRQLKKQLGGGGPNQSWKSDLCPFTLLSSTGLGKQQKKLFS